MADQDGSAAPSAEAQLSGVGSDAPIAAEEQTVEPAKGQAKDSEGAVATEASSASPVPLHAVGFCGVDETVDPLALAEISGATPWAEWGVLFRPEKEGQPRFPGKEWVEKLAAAARANGSQLAAHLCSSRCEEVLRGDCTFVQSLYELGFRRVQVNATSANGVDSSNLAAQVDSLLSSIRAAPGIEWILQRNTETQPLWEPILALGEADRPSNMSVLFDDSVGTGVERQTFPCPTTARGLPCGYAGGLGPKNIRSILERMHDSVGGSFNTLRAPWVDMESSLRSVDAATSEDTFSLENVKQCIQNVQNAAADGIVNLP
mmetsp:Transcript_19825/g.35249  ORF Transcript_19825/g.35249 Transcript_19825/m.35249 type:complete len:318 (+) Transcript_19825:189-1142(+)